LLLVGRSVLATVLFTDIVGSTEQAAAFGDRRWTELLRRHHAAVRSQLSRFDGEELQTAGDGFLASFESAGQAVRCGSSIVEAVQELGLSVRAGVHTGECEVVDDTLGGLAVHIGARICAQAQPNEVLVSSTVCDLLAGSGLTFIDQGLRSLRGVPGAWHVYSLEQPEELSPRSARVQLCGKVVVELHGKRIEEELPGRQGRVLFSYLVVNRQRPVGRDQIVEALWGDRLPADADSGLSALLSKLRRTLGPDRLDGRSTLQLQLPEGSWVDVETAFDAIHRAESAARRSDWPEAWSAARVSLHIARRPFLAGEDSLWIESMRDELSDVLVRALETSSQSSLAIGGNELDTAERCARALLKEAPFRESGYRLLMEVQARRGNMAEALQTYESLRRRLRDELGASPSPATEELHLRMIQ
jgi:class 3 adenylate cyclase/DNA-binding SARP family transcriptional activator